MVSASSPLPPADGSPLPRGDGSPLPRGDGSAGPDGPRDPTALADRLRVTMVRLGRQLRRQDPPVPNITLYSALATVADHGELAIGELAAAEHLPSSAASRIADRLEEAGWVCRHPNPQDRRGVNLSVTAEGQRLIEQRRTQGNAWLTARLVRLTPSQHCTLSEALCLLEALVLGDDEPGPTTSRDSTTKDGAR